MIYKLEKPTKTNMGWYVGVEDDWTLNLRKNSEVLFGIGFNEDNSGYFETKKDAKKAIKKYYELNKNKEENTLQVSSVYDEPAITLEHVVGVQYRHLKIDTVKWSKANHTAEQQKAICQFMINKYSMRDKNQDEDDIIKIRYYIDWLETLTAV